MSSAPNVTHLRSAIDRGKTGDKIPYSDPAAAPLGTDEEAAGTPLSRPAVSTALDTEMSRRSVDPNPDRKLVNSVIIAVGIAIGGLVIVAILLVYQNGM
jgi:hypothetical protein